MYTIAQASPGSHAELCAGNRGCSVTASTPPFSTGETCSYARQSGRCSDGPERSASLGQASACAGVASRQASHAHASSTLAQAHTLGLLLIGPPSGGLLRIAAPITPHP